MHEISLKAEHIFSIGSFDITNAMLVTLLISIGVVIFALIAGKKISSAGKMSGVQNLLEAVFDGAFSLMDTVTGDRKQSKRFFPLVMTLFVVVLLSNWSGLIPGVGPIVVKEQVVAAAETEVDSPGEEIVQQQEVHEEDAKTEEEHAVSEEGTHEKSVPLFRAPSADLNTTLALAIISLFSFQLFGITALGLFKYGSRFLNFKGPIDFFIGILEIIGEVAKMISLSFRLFGNVFAGEVLLLVIAFLLPLIAPLPFFFLEIFVGMIQAFIFAMLTLVFLKVATTSSH